jgi:type VI secretion system secreted protein Hcp
MAIFAKFDKIKGSATEAEHKDQIEIQSFSWGASRSMLMQGSRRESSHPTTTEVHITKHQDVSSNKLLMDLYKGTANNKVEIAFTTMVAGKPEQYLLLKLENTAVSSYQLADSDGGSRAMESISLSFTKFSVTTKSIDSAGKSSPDTVGWDIAENKSS